MLVAAQLAVLQRVEMRGAMLLAELGRIVDLFACAGGLAWRTFRLSALRGLPNGVVAPLMGANIAGCPAGVGNG
eukprot:5968958-Pyramimonas_sp.AAC.1